MADGTQDLSNLFTRVSALEQADVDSDQTVARIVKLYATLGLKVTITATLHQYWVCGQTETFFLAPNFPAANTITCSTDRIL